MKVDGPRQPELLETRHTPNEGDLVATNLRMLPLLRCAHTMIACTTATVVIETWVAMVDEVEVAAAEEAELFIVEEAVANTVEDDLAIVIVAYLFQHQRKDAAEGVRRKNPHEERTRNILIWDPRQRRCLPPGDDTTMMGALNHRLEAAPVIGEDPVHLPHHNEPALSAHMLLLQQIQCLPRIHHLD